MWYLIGTLVASAAVGVTLGAAGDLMLAPLGLETSTKLMLLGAAGVVGVVLDVGFFNIRLPTVHRQVDDEWMYQFRGWFYGLGFGIQLGAGVVTVVTSSAIYVSFLAAFLCESALGGLLTVSAMGLVRGLSLLVARHVQEPDQLFRLNAALEKLDVWSRGATIGLQASASALLVALSAKY